MIDTKTGERVMKTILEIKNNDALYNPISKLVKLLPDLSEEVLLAAISDFESNGLLKTLYGDNTLITIFVKPSATGYLRKLEEDKQLNSLNQPHIQQNFNVATNYGAIGTNTGFTINNSFDFKELDRLINEHTAPNSVDRNELNELKQQLELIQQHNIPISKGYLSKFSDIMQKHDWLTSPLTSFILGWIFTK